MVVPRTKLGWGNNRGAASGQNSVVLQEAVVRGQKLPDMPAIHIYLKAELAVSRLHIFLTFLYVNRGQGQH